MGSRVAQWAFAAVYLVIAIIAVWGGVMALNPPLPEPSPFNPDPLPLLVNSAMVVEAIFYFVTAAGFLAAAGYSARVTQGGASLSSVANIGFATFLILVGAYLLWFGAQLLMLGGSFYYALVGLALVATGVLLIMRNPIGAMVYAGIVALTVVWTFMEAGLDFLAELPRLAAWLVVGLWFLTPWHRAAMGKTPETPVNAGGLYNAIAVGAGALMLVVGAVQGYPVAEGTKNEVAAGPAVTDWQHYGGVPEGQRFAQITQINPENVGQLKEVWRQRTGVGYDFKQTPQ
ncbi:MAG: hypothetical protein EON93_04585, partial [Burkholderiales bacterium]